MDLQNNVNNLEILIVSVKKTLFFLLCAILFCFFQFFFVHLSVFIYQEVLEQLVNRSSPVLPVQRGLGAAAGGRLGATGGRLAATGGRLAAAGPPPPPPPYPFTRRQRNLSQRSGRTLLPPRGGEWMGPRGEREKLSRSHNRRR